MREITELRHASAKLDSHETTAARLENELPVDALRELLVHARIFTRRARGVGVEGLEFLTVVAEEKRKRRSGTEKRGSEEGRKRRT